MNWRLRRLGNCAKFLSGGTPSKARTEFWEGDIPWVSSGEMAQDRVHDTPLRITAAAAQEGSRLVPANTVLVVVRGMSLAKEFRVALTRREVAFNQDLKALVCVSDVEPEFLFYALRARRENIRDLATEASHGTKKLETEVLAALEVPVPKPEVQRRVIEVLSAYDDLIENNRRRMALLEESARLLYREWFVRLRFPGHERTQIVGRVPEGWQRGCVSDFYDTASGGTPSRTNPNFFTGETPWVKTQELRNGFITDTEEKITEDALNKSAAKIFPDRTVLVAMYGATIGQLGIIATPAASNQACCAIMPRDTRASFIHAYLFFVNNKEELIGLAMGAAQNNINQQIIRSYPMVMPSRRLAELFRDSMTPVFDQCLNLHRQNEQLRAARDLLLPRLMSGGMEVRQYDQENP